MADKPTITINHQKIEFVPLDDYDIDEAVVLYEWCQMTLDQVAEIKGFVPGVVAGLIHVSVQRANPNISKKAVRDMVGKLKVVDLQTVFEDMTVETTKDDAGPPANALESENGNDSSSAPSGTRSSNGSEVSLGNDPAETSGHPSWETSAISGPVTSDR